MKIVVPVLNKQVCLHFGHCQVFSFFDIDENTLTIKGRNDLEPPPHEPGVLPRWVKEQGGDLVLAGGIGQRAQDLFRQNGVEVVMGLVETDPEKAVQSYLDKTLKIGSNPCDH